MDNLAPTEFSIYLDVRICYFSAIAFRSARFILFLLASEIASIPPVAVGG